MNDPVYLIRRSDIFFVGGCGMSWYITLCYACNGEVLHTILAMIPTVLLTHSLYVSVVKVERVK